MKQKYFSIIYELNMLFVLFLIFNFTCLLSKSFEFSKQDSSVFFKSLVEAPFSPSNYQTNLSPATTAPPHRRRAGISFPHIHSTLSLPIDNFPSLVHCKLTNPPTNLAAHSYKSIILNKEKKSRQLQKEMAVAAYGQLNLDESPAWGSRSVDCFEKLEQIGEGTYGLAFTFL